MDEPKIVPPAWLPWATTACLAALVACLGELLVIERTRAQFLREQAQLADAAMKGAQNQLEVERIVGRRALERLRAGDEEILLLAPPEGASPGGPAQGALVWSAAEHSGRIRVSAADQPEGRDYQLWLDGPGTSYPAPCAVFHGSPGPGGSAARVEAGAPLVPGCRFLLVDGAKGGSPTLAEARAGGSIVLATLPYTGSNPRR